MTAGIGFSHDPEQDKWKRTDWWMDCQSSGLYNEHCFTANMHISEHTSNASLQNPREGMASSPVCVFFGSSRQSHRHNHLDSVGHFFSTHVIVSLVQLLLLLLLIGWQQKGLRAETVCWCIVKCRLHNGSRLPHLHSFSTLQSDDIG